MFRLLDPSNRATEELLERYKVFVAGKLRLVEQDVFLYEKEAYLRELGLPPDFDLALH